MGNRITELYCWIALDPADDNEGIPATNLSIAGRDYMVPLLGADTARMTSLRKHAERVRAEMPGVAFTLRRFVITEEVVDEL
jgi:hypothetical protein